MNLIPCPPFRFNRRASYSEGMPSAKSDGMARKKKTDASTFSPCVTFLRNIILLLLISNDTVFLRSVSVECGQDLLARQFFGGYPDSG